MKQYWIACGLVIGFLMSVQAIVPGRIDRVEATEIGMALTVETTEGKVYQLQCRTSLAEGGWINEGLPVVASGRLNPRPPAAFSGWWKQTGIPRMCWFPRRPRRPRRFRAKAPPHRRAGRKSFSRQQVFNAEKV